MTPYEWVVSALWVVTMGALLWWALRKVDRDEAELERGTEMQNWPEG